MHDVVSKSLLSAVRSIYLEARVGRRRVIGHSIFGEVWLVVNVVLRSCSLWAGSVCMLILSSWLALWLMVDAVSRTEMKDGALTMHYTNPMVTSIPLLPSYS